MSEISAAINCDNCDHFAEFKSFVKNIAGVPAGAMPADDLLCFAYRFAKDTVLPDIRCSSETVYWMCVFNLAMSYLIQIAPDNPDGDAPDYWSSQRTSCGYNNFTPGLISSSSDNSTSQSWEIPDSLKDASLLTLANLKNRFGLAYETIAQQYRGIWVLR